MHFRGINFVNMNTAGYLASVFIGISLGLVGAGGSILTVPVLVYLFGLDALSATVYSLFIVGITSIAGAVSYFRKGMVNVRTAVLFGIPSIISVFFTRTYLVPVIPEVILTTGQYTLTKDILLMLLFALLMVSAAYSMIRNNVPDVHNAYRNRPLGYLHVFIQGVFVGVVTGFVGAGGGFLIIPALVNLLKMPIRAAVGTSLVIIALNSISGFLFSLSRIAVHWGFLAGIAGIATGGILIGSYLSSRIDGRRLKPTFGWFVLVMGVYIIFRETWIK